MTSLFARITVSALIASNAWSSSELWTPPTRPTNCSTINVENNVLDLSGSMQKKDLLETLKKQLLPDIASAQPCRLVIIAGFGITFDVIDGGFGDDAAVRDRLMTVVRTLKATQAQTNLDEAAKGIEWVHSRLKHAYGEAFSHRVRVLTDDEAAPSPGKKPFSIATYFRNLGGVEQMTVVEAQIDAEGAHLGASRGAGQGEIKVVRLEDVMVAMLAIR